MTFDEFNSCKTVSGYPGIVLPCPVDPFGLGLSGKSRRCCSYIAFFAVKGQLEKALRWTEILGTINGRDDLTLRDVLLAYLSFPPFPDSTVSRFEVITAYNKYCV